MNLLYFFIILLFNETSQAQHIFVFSMFLPKFRKAMRRENKIGKKQPESYRVIFGILIGTIVPVLMSTTIYNMVQSWISGCLKTCSYTGILSYGLFPSGGHFFR